jgi:hypothetical protein
LFEDNYQALITVATPAKEETDGELMFKFTFPFSLFFLNRIPFIDNFISLLKGILSLM